MSRCRLFPILILGCLILGFGAGPAHAVKLPMIEGKEAVASVNGEAISLDDLLRQIGGMHEGVTEPAAMIHKPDLTALLQRLINARLILQEARAIGLDQQPEFIERGAALRVDLLKGLLVKQKVTGVSAADPALVDRLYRDAVRQVTVDSLLFPKEEEARAFSEALRAGGEFQALAAKTIAAGQARGAEGGARALQVGALHPEVAKAVLAMQAGGSSDPIRLADGFTIVKLLEVRYPEDTAAHARAEAEALEAARQAKLQGYMDGLRKQYTQVDRSVMDGLNYESVIPGLDSLRRDERIIARVKGAAPVTVKELTESVEKKFYHGLEGAIERKRVNDELPLILDRILLERVTLLEAGRLKIEKSEAYRTAFREQINGQLFDTFVRKVINPGVKIEEAALKTYYDEHLGDFSSPRMMRIEGLAFAGKDNAQRALDRLRAGSDLKWMRDNTDGQAGRDKFPGLLSFSGSPVVVSSLPAGAQDALAGAMAGDLRFFAEEGGPAYVLSVREVFTAAPEPYDAVRASIASRVFETRRQAAIEEYAAKLRAAGEVRILAGPGDLEEILGLKAAAGR